MNRGPVHNVCVNARIIQRQKETHMGNVCAKPDTQCVMVYAYRITQHQIPMNLVLGTMIPVVKIRERMIPVLVLKKKPN